MQSPGRNAGALFFAFLNGSAAISGSGKQLLRQAPDRMNTNS